MDDTAPRRRASDAQGPPIEDSFHFLVKNVEEYAIFSMDPEGVITHWNTGAERMKGYTEAEAVGQHIQMLYLPEDREAGRPEHNLREAALYGEYHEQGGRRRKSGEDFLADITIGVLKDEAGEVRGFVKITKDLTETKRAEGTKRAEEALRASNEGLEQRNAEQDAFIYTVSHDLRSPLLSIQGMADLLDEAARGGDAGEASFYLERLTSNVERMGRLLDDLLALSRVGRSEEEAGPLPLGPVVEAVIAELEPRARERGVVLELPQTWPTVRCARSEAEQVLVNLLGNAVKFAAREGVGARVRVGWEAKGDGTVAVRVSDDGPGVPLEQRERVFGLFQRLDPKVEGTGVGLAIVQRIVLRHGGRVWVEDSDLGGAAFVVTLPAG